MSHSEALKGAGAFFERCDLQWTARNAGALDQKIESIEQVCRAYVDNLRAEKGDFAANDAQQKLTISVYDTKFGRTRCILLAASHVQRWRNGLVTPTRQRNSANRIYRAFVAAMNWGRRHGYITTDLAWKNVGEFPVGDGKREIYVSEMQRTALLLACDAAITPEELQEDPWLRYCTPDLGDLLRGYFFTGARPGELVKVRVGAFNRREKCMTIICAKNKKGEARPRIFYLYEPAAFAFFERLASGKTPQDYLVTKSNGSSWMFENTGRPRYRDWARGIKSAIRRANEVLLDDERLSEEFVAYCSRHAVITDLLSKDALDQVVVEKITGTSSAMIRNYYYKVVNERLKKALEARRSI